MADNTTFTPGSGASLATDVIGGVHFQRVKIAQGADGSATDVSSAAPLPVDGTVAATQSGTWNVATVTAVTSVTNPVASTQSGTWTVGISATPSVTVKRAAISASTSGDNTLVAAVVGAKIKVLSFVLIASGDVDARLESGAGGTALTGVMSLAADGNGFVLPPALPGYHWMETAANTLLNLELSGAVQVSGFLTYYEEA